MIHSHMTAALAEQHRNQLHADATRHRLVREARRARRAVDPLDSRATRWAKKLLGGAVE